MMNKPRWALFLGVLCISIFPILIRMQLSSGLISAFYRMAIASVVLVPYAYFSGNLNLYTPVLSILLYFAELFLRWILLSGIFPYKTPLLHKLHF
ncbi:membrane hypothetical protein [Capnocytophaga canimorsus]|nr:membrane hypothetical protein [Capnocytophaga canimorsus]